MLASYGSQDCCSQCSWPLDSLLSTQASTRDSWLSLAQSLVGATAHFSWVLVSTKFCLCPPRICFPSPAEVLYSNPTGLQSQPLGRTGSVLLSDPQVRKSVVCPRTFAKVWELIWYNCSQIFGSTAQCSILELMVTYFKRGEIASEEMKRLRWSENDT